MGSLFTHYTGLEIHRINNTINARIIDVHYTYAYLSTYFEKKESHKGYINEVVHWQESLNCNDICLSVIKIITNIIYICILFKQKKAFGFDVFRKRRIQS